VEELAAVGEPVVVGGAEAKHLLRALRKSAGDQVILFDGRGGEFLAVIQACRSREVVLQLEQQLEPRTEMPGHLVIAAALPQGDRQRFLIEKLVELGTHQFVPLVTHRCRVKPGRQHVEKFTRYVIEASKQCGRSQLMTISHPQGLDKLPHLEFQGNKYVWHPEDPAEASGKWVDGLETDPVASRPDPSCATSSPVSEAKHLSGWHEWHAIGPEGGFTDSEIDCFARQGFRRRSAGSRILRIETAAIFAASQFVARAENLSPQAE